MPHSFQYKDRRVIIVDTPGFDDTNLSDAEVLKIIAHFLSTTYRQEIQLAGVIYLHKITDNRLGGSGAKNLRMFKKLCGENFYSSVVLATTMWGNMVGSEMLAMGEERERQLIDNSDWWGLLTQRGSKVFRHDDSDPRESALAIVGHLLDTGHNAVLDIQRQLVDEHRTLQETAAGEEVSEDLIAMKKQHEEDIAELKQGQQDAERMNDQKLAAALMNERMVAQKAMLQAEKDKHDLQMDFQKMSMDMELRYSTALIGQETLRSQLQNHQKVTEESQEQWQKQRQDDKKRHQRERADDKAAWDEQKQRDKAEGQADERRHQKQRAEDKNAWNGLIEQNNADREENERRHERQRAKEQQASEATNLHHQNTLVMMKQEIEDQKQMASQKDIKDRQARADERQATDDKERRFELRQAQDQESWKARLAAQTQAQKQKHESTLEEWKLYAEGQKAGRNREKNKQELEINRLREELVEVRSMVSSRRSSIDWNYNSSDEDFGSDKVASSSNEDKYDSSSRSASTKSNMGGLALLGLTCSLFLVS